MAPISIITWPEITVFPSRKYQNRLSIFFSLPFIPAIVYLRYFYLCALKRNVICTVFGFLFSHHCLDRAFIVAKTTYYWLIFPTRNKLLNDTFFL